MKFKFTVRATAFVLAPQVFAQTKWLWWSNKNRQPDRLLKPKWHKL